MLDANKLTELTDIGFKTNMKSHLNLYTLGSYHISSQLKIVQNSSSERRILFLFKYKMAKFYQLCIISKIKGFCCMIIELLETNWRNISGAQ